MEKTIKETTRLLLNGILTKEDADKILLDLYNLNEQVCLHPDKYFVSGVFGGYWCPKCNRNVDSEIEQD